MFAVFAVIAIIQSVAAVALTLVVLGIGLSALTWWFWTTARPEPVSLAPLEIMSDRRYMRANEAERKHMMISAHGLVRAATRRQSQRQLDQHPDRDIQPEQSPHKPVDPLLR